MSSDLYCTAFGAESRARCDAGFATSILESNISCVLIDRNALVARASEPLLAVAPTIVGRHVSEAFNLDSAALDVAHGRCSAYGIYRDPDGQLVPATLRALYEIEDSDGSLLVGVTDGAPFRRAEAERFASTPYPIMRVTPDGIIRFANDEARWTLAPAGAEIVGQPLAALFGANEEKLLMDALSQCVCDHTPQTIEVAPWTSQASTDNHKRLLLTPDLAPNQKALGALAVIQSSIVERIRDQISKVALDPTIHHWRERLSAIVNHLRHVIDFDHANFGIYADDVTLFQALCTYPEDEKKWKWPARWMELPPGIRAWLEEGRTWIPSIPEFVGKSELRRNEVVRHYERLKVLSSVTLAAQGARGATSALTLCSLELGKYGARDLTFLRELDLEAVLIRIEEEIQAERRMFAAALKQSIAKTRCLHDAAEESVKRIARHFHWDNVALFRVDRHKRRFELVHQSPCRRLFRLPEDYWQDIDKGMLAATLDKGRALTIDEIGAEESEQYGFVDVGRPTRSAMTIPMRLNKRIRWIFDIESEVAQAFRGPDKLAIEELVRVMQDGLKQRMLAEIKNYLLKEAEQGVLVVGIEGAILEMNGTAAKLLGRTTAQIAEGEALFLSAYVDDPDPELTEVLSGFQSIERHRMTLRGEDGRTRTALGTRTVLEESFDTALWFLTDIETDRWTVDLSFLRETVSDVAQQTRAPLAMASTMARRLSGLVDGEQVASLRGSDLVSSAGVLCRGLVEELGKADITFERLAEGLAIRKDPLRPEVAERIDLAFRVQDVIDSLPTRDRQRITFNDVDLRCPVHADAGRIGFALRSLIAYLLRARVEPYTGVMVHLSQADGHATLTLSLTPSRPEQTQGPAVPPPADALWRAHSFARDDAGLASSAVDAVVAAHHGSLEMQSVVNDGRDPSPGWTGFRIELPLIERAEP
jgi:PAS domain-containing protein